MPSRDTTPTRSARDFGPIQILDATLGRQLLGLALAFVGVQLISWAVDGHAALSSAVVYTAVGTFVLCNGLYVGGVRFD
jgi:NhaP-type Na+/H+ or K+/H+ antiporter